MDSTGTGPYVLSVLRAGWEGSMGYEMTFEALLSMVVLVTLRGLTGTLESLKHFWTETGRFRRIQKALRADVSVGGVKIVSIATCQPLVSLIRLHLLTTCKSRF